MKLNRIALIGGAMTAVTFAYSFFRINQLPDRIPMHFNAAGQVDRYGSKTEALLFTPLMMLGLLLLFAWIPGRLPKEQRSPQFDKVWEPITLVVVGFMACVQFMILNPGALGTGQGQVKFMMVAMSVLFIVLGNLMGKTERNYVMGIRTPWTLASDEVWHRTHRLAGQMMVGTGIACLLMALIGLNVLIITAVILIGTLYPVWYSYALYRKLNPQ